MRFAIGWAALCLALPLCAQVQEQSQAPVRTYNLLRENEDWSFLADPSLRSDFWDPIKYIPLGCKACYVSLGGEIREVFEQVANDNWGTQPYTNTFLLQRYMLHSDWHLGKNFRIFVQLKSGLEDFRTGGPRPIDEKRLDFEAAFFEVGNTHKKNWAVFRVGRQELNYGSGRPVSAREGPNVRQSFDGVRIRSKVGAWNVDAWAVRPDLDKVGFFDNTPDHTTGFGGLYATRPLRRGVAFDAYYLGIDRKSATFERGTATELRHTVGARLSRPIATEKPGFDFDYEGMVQFGTFGSGDIRAWTFASDTGYSLTSVRLRPRLSVKADISSGDNPGSHTLGTFNPIYPIGKYFGVLADTGPGPVNFIDVHPQIQTQLGHGVSAVADLVVQWRESLNDGVYAVPGFLLVPADGSRARFVGYRPGAEVRWQIDHHAYLQADYGIFYAGEFLKQASPGRNINYVEFWAGYKF
ncbi:MAG TPA: alginate export family protein [Bryobacteraceae bacterium]|nr:alginate export family protein [Bryobacteraceae bacterium]